MVLLCSLTYDKWGNIKTQSKDGVLQESYTYDGLNQLKTVTKGSDVYEYTYDNGGNILNVKLNGVVTDTYTYGDANWKDKLTAYNGQTITYDGIGNPLTYRDGMTFSWQNGRRLSSLQQGESVVQYTYDDSGLRIAKNLNGTSTNFYYDDSGRLFRIGDGSGMFWLFYGTDGSAMSFKHRDIRYYYVKNQQGDITAIVDMFGNTVAKYSYDVWGKPLSITDGNGNDVSANGTHIANINPLRYRGYYYDAESGLYYLQSRYYDPEVGRFISADSQLNTSLGILGMNQFSYCSNNPVNLVDYGGNKPGDLFDTMDEAARDAAIYLGALSFENGWEYITVIYSVNKIEKNYKTITKTYRFLWWSWTKTRTIKILKKVKKYTYQAVVTDKDPWEVSIPNAPPFKKSLATVHTHPMGSGQGITRFSNGDKKTANKLKLIDYVYGPDGVLRRYDPSTGEDIPIFFDLPVSTKKPWLE